MFLTPEVLALQILNLIFFIFATIAFFLNVKIFFKWDISSTQTAQYKLEKQSYLASVIIKYIFIIKIPLFIFFIFTLDKLSNIINGAMCAAGIVDATSYGTYLLLFKIINIYLFGFWLVLHKVDMTKENLPYTKLKSGFFLFLYLLLVIEILIEFLMFNNIDINQIVLCCGSLYSSTASSYISLIFQINPLIIVSLFYISFVLMVIFAICKQKELFAFSNVLLLILSIISLIVFFGTYIYELPTHHCPFCFLQHDYNYIGYLLYVILFIGTFYGILSSFRQINSEKNNLSNTTISLIFNFIYLVLVSSYPILFYFRNGVWL